MKKYVVKRVETGMILSYLP